MTDTTLQGGSDKLARATLGRQIAEAIRRDIVFGRLEPGTKLAQQQVCERFGTSRMPVRDALRQLQYEGFLTSDDGRHSVVARMSRRDIEDTFLIEGMLHAFAIRRVVQDATEDEVAELVERHEEMVERADDLQAMAELNWHFHRRVNQMARSGKLVAALRTLALSIPRDFVVEFPDWVKRANDEHSQIVAAVTKRDADLAERLMRDHVASAGHDLVAYLELKGVDLE